MSVSRTTHGHTRLGKISVEFKTWDMMIDRCHNPHNRQWADYGGRGITVAEEWRHDFLAFFNHIGPRPESSSVRYTIDRINNDHGYEPGNVRWATYQEQARNRRSTVMLTYDGRTQCMTAWANELGIKVCTLHRRLKKGWPVERALTFQRSLTRKVAS